MSTENLLDDIYDVNLSYLLLMQRLINCDRELAMFRLKIGEEMADLLSTISVQELARLARCNQLLCHFSLHSSSQLFSLVNASKDDDMQQVHTAILLSAQEADEQTDTGDKKSRRSARRTSARNGMIGNGIPHSAAAAAANRHAG